MESPQQEDVLSKLFKDSVFSPNYGYYFIYLFL